MKYVHGWACPDQLSGPNKWLKRLGVIDEALRHWAGPRRRVIQAGGHIGIWPCALAQDFDAVLTIEAAPENYACLVQNTRDYPGITTRYGALGAGEEALPMALHPNSSGAHSVAVSARQTTVTVPGHMIDAWELDEVNAIFLDIEGYEWSALHGAVQTLARCSPLLVLEQNKTCVKYGVPIGHVAAWLAATFGYRQVASYEEDVILIRRLRSRL